MGESLRDPTDLNGNRPSAYRGMSRARGARQRGRGVLEISRRRLAHTQPTPAAFQRQLTPGRRPPGRARHLELRVVAQLGWAGFALGKNADTNSTNLSVFLEHQAGKQP